MGRRFHTIQERCFMATELIRADEHGIARAAQVIRAGGIVGFPTETVYGLGANALDPDAVPGIFAAKGRPADNPLIVHIADMGDIAPLISGDLPEQARLLAEAYWPGPMTLVLPKSALIPDAVSAGLDTVGIRMPAHPVARALIRECGLPIAAPSANRSGRPSPTCARDVLEDMDGRIPMILDGGPCGIGLESTVISLLDGEARILRPGGVTPEMVERVLGGVIVDSTALKPLAEGQVARSPGMKYRHYAPKGKLILIDGEAERVKAALRARYAEEHARGLRVCLLLPEALMEEFRNMRAYSLGRNEEEASQRVFAALRQLDRDGIDVAFCQTFDTHGIGLALMNRLDRAAGFAVEKV